MARFAASVASLEKVEKGVKPMRPVDSPHRRIQNLRPEQFFIMYQQELAKISRQPTAEFRGRKSTGAPST